MSGAVGSAKLAKQYKGIVFDCVRTDDVKRGENGNVLRFESYLFKSAPAV